MKYNILYVDGVIFSSMISYIVQNLADINSGEDDNEGQAEETYESVKRETKFLMSRYMRAVVHG